MVITATLTVHYQIPDFLNPKIKSSIKMKYLEQKTVLLLNLVQGFKTVAYYGEWHVGGDVGA